MQTGTFVQIKSLLFLWQSSLKRTSGRAFVNWVRRLPLQSANWYGYVCIYVCVCVCVCVCDCECMCADAHVWRWCLFYHRPSGFPLKSRSWANTSCCLQKGHCQNDRWTGCTDKRNTDPVKNHFSSDNCTNKGHSSSKLLIEDKWTYFQIFSCETGALTQKWSCWIFERARN